MANHARLFSTNIPSDPEVIDRDMREFVSTKFPMLTLRRGEGVEGDRYWSVSCPGWEFDSVQMWLQDRDDEFHFTKIYAADYDGDEVDPKCEVLDFRHGHGLKIWWWLECEVRMYFARKYQCGAYDEGIGFYDEKQEYFENYAQYLKVTLTGHPNSEKLFELEKEMILEHYADGLPAELRGLLGF